MDYSNIITPNRLTNMQEMEVIVDGPDGANRLFIYSGMAEYEGRLLSKWSNRLAWAALLIALVSLVVSLRGCFSRLGPATPLAPRACSSGRARSATCSTILCCMVSTSSHSGAPSSSTWAPV